MMTQDELATVRAALRYWIDEVVPAGDDVSRYYRDDSNGVNLSRAQVERLIERFNSENVRYLPLSDNHQSLKLLLDASSRPDSRRDCALVILPLADQGH